MKKSALLFLGILCFSTAASATVLTARFTFDDGSPVAGTVMLLRAAAPQDVVIGRYQLDSQGFVSTDITIDPTANYRAQLLGLDGSLLQEVWTVSPSSEFVLAGLAALGSGEVDIVLGKTDNSVKSVLFAPFATTLIFDNPTPPGSAGTTIIGVYKDVDWGSGAWVWEAAFGPDPNNNISFSSNDMTPRSFSFARPRVLQSMRLYSISDGTLVLSSDGGETKSQFIPAGRMLTVATGWTKQAIRITVSFTGGWDLGIDQIIYQ